MSAEGDASSIGIPARAPDAHGVQAAIARAKYEWECTADALPHLVCLLDTNRRIVRVNRVIERWELGSISDALGRDLHQMLHPSCVDAGCALVTSMEACWQSLPLGESLDLDIHDSVPERVLHLSLRSVLARASSIVAPTDILAVAIVSDVTVLRVAEAALRNMNLELESRVRIRTDALADANRDLQNEVIRRESAEQELRSSRNALAMLSHQLMTAQEVERKRIARELHDSVGQALSAIKYSLERGAELANQSRLRDPQPIWNRAVGALQDAIDEIRSIAMNLRPSILDDLGAASAVSWFCREFVQSYPTIQLREQISVADCEVPERLSTAVFRSLQELLNNVAKHAHARQVRVALFREPEQLVLEVVDDGVGLAGAPSAATARSGRGIHNLRERAEMTGGQLSLSAAQTGSGTRARIQWLLAPAEAVASETV